MRPSTKALLSAFAALAAALLPALWLWGFTVDDALISLRVAHQLATGHGYRFNAEGPVVDAVTPLGWAFVLVPFSASGPLEALAAAKLIGLGAWLIAAVGLGVLLARLGPRSLGVGCVALGSCLPLAAWSVSGMETGLVVALCTAGLFATPWAPLALGLAAAWRPELLPWAATFSVVRAALEPFPYAGVRPRRIALTLALVLGPFVLVAWLRLSMFGQAAPLSLIAKPSDALHGLRYALGSLVFSGPAWLLPAGRSYARTGARTRASLLALGAHLTALILAGGDWMPLYRLLVPVLPSVILAGAELAELSASRRVVALRLGAMLAVSAMLAFTLGPKARGVLAQRQALIAQARPVLANARRIAALDVGWVGAASSAHIVDLAGVTDPSIARLPGGHTSKRLPEGLLEVRAIDTVILLADRAKLADWPALDFVRHVESRIPDLLSFSEFRPVALLPLSGTTHSYVIATRSIP